MRMEILIAGPAGTGPNFITHILGELLIKKGYYVFYSRDYQSLIRGGHNFNILSFSDEPIYSNNSKIDILVALDEKSIQKHEKKLKEKGILIKGKEKNSYLLGAVAKTLGIEFSYIEENLKQKENFEENIKEAKKGYDSFEKKFEIRALKNKKIEFLNGSKGIAFGAVNSGLEFYYAYPMTPATPVLTELAQMSLENKHLTIELENEIAVVNAGIGSAITGAKVMVGTSGGGFDLMSEGLSLTGIAKVPLVFYLAQRPGPGTGVATYTAQGDLKLALNAGHGEFQRVVLAPGDPIEAQELVAQGFYFSHKFKIPSIIISDKHLGESFYSCSEKPKFIKINSKVKLERYNSYEKDSEGSATEDSRIIKENILRRKSKLKEIEKEAEKFEMFKFFGNKNSKNIVIGWGSTKGAILDAIKGLDIGFIQILYLSPFPKIEEIIKDKNLILVENNSTGQLGDVLREKTGILIEEGNKILRFDGRPFFADELKKEIEGRLR